MKQQFYIYFILNLILTCPFYSFINGAATIINEEQDRDSQSDLLDKIIKAIQAKDITILKELLDKDFNINSKYGPNGSTPLMYAAESGDVEIVKFLLDYDFKIDIDVDIENNDSSNALDYAVVFANPDIVDLLLKNGAYIKRENRQGVYSILEFALALYSKNLEKEATNKDDLCIKKNLENLSKIIELMIKADVALDYNLLDKIKKLNLNNIIDLIDNKEKLEETIFNVVLEGDIEKIKNLIEQHQYCINYAFSKAVEFKKPEIIKLLINKGANLTINNIYICGYIVEDIIAAAIFHDDGEWESVNHDDYIATIKLLLNESEEIEVNSEHLKYLQTTIESLAKKHKELF